MLDNSAVFNLTLHEALASLYLSFRAKRLSAATLDHTKSPADTLAPYLKEGPVERPGDLISERVNRFLGQVRQRDRTDGQRPLADHTAHVITRGTTGMLMFLYSEACLTTPIAVPTPPSGLRFPPSLAQDHVRTIVSWCPSRRDEAPLLLLAASKGRGKGTARRSSIKIIRPTSTPSMDQWDLEILINVLELILRNQLARSDPPASHNDPGENST